MAFYTWCFSTPIALVVILASIIPLVVLYVGRSIIIKRRKANKMERSIGCVPATVMHIGVDAETYREGWVVKAAWKDERTRQSYIFHSQPQALRPKQKIGDKVLVMIDSNNPMRYTIEL